MINNFHFQNFWLRNDGTRTLSLFAQLNDRELVIDLDSARCMILGLQYMLAGDQNARDELDDHGWAICEVGGVVTLLLRDDPDEEPQPVVMDTGEAARLAVLLRQWVEDKPQVDTAAEEACAMAVRCLERTVVDSPWDWQVRVYQGGGATVTAMSAKQASGFVVQGGHQGLADGFRAMANKDRPEAEGPIGNWRMVRKNDQVLTSSTGGTETMTPGAAALVALAIDRMAADLNPPMVSIGGVRGVRNGTFAIWRSAEEEQAAAIWAYLRTRLAPEEIANFEVREPDEERAARVDAAARAAMEAKGKWRVGRYRTLHYLECRRGHHSLTVSGPLDDDEARRVLEEVADRLNFDA